MMTNAAHHIRAAVEGLAREIGRRVGQEQRDLNERAGPPGVEFWTATVERHAKAVLLDYLLGDFKPVKPDEVQPHHYVPSTMHMGDCNVCGHTQNSPMHLHVRK